MFSRRYQYPEAGRRAFPAFVMLGLVAGALAARLLPGAAPVWLSSLLWAMIGGVTAFTVFAAEGSQPRPASVGQAALADGIITGMLMFTSGGVLELIVASGAGSNANHAVSIFTWGATLAASLALGAVFGAPAGYLLYRVGGREVMTRIPPVTSSRKRSGSSRKRRKRS